MAKTSRLLALGLIAADLLMLAAAMALSFAFRYRSAFWPEATTGPTRPTVVFAALTVLIFMLLFAVNRLYDLETLFAGHREYAAVAKGGTYGIAVVLILAFLTDEPISRGALVLFWLLAVPLVGVSRFLIRRLVYRLRRAGLFIRKWLVVGTDEHAIAVARHLNWPTVTGIQIVGFLDDYRPVGSRVVDGLRVLGDPRSVREIARSHGVATLLVIPPAISWESYRDLLELAAENTGIGIQLAPGLQHLVATGAQMTDSGFLPLVKLQLLRITGFNAVLKRALDILISSLLLAFVAPGWLLCWFAAQLDGCGPTLAREPVLGRKERFDLLMVAAPPEPPPEHWPERWAWRWRRAVAASRLGKLPNVINVIAGRMSLVGPRAVAESEASKGQPWVRNLLLVRPGLTGPAADASRNEGVEQQTLKDIAYVRDYSIWLDLRLMFASLKRMLRRESSLPSSYVVVQPSKREVAATRRTAGRMP
ncbi:MAG: sugar transferase [Dehalococcoidia bacterium]|jgi:lipopolysaccharide/colanic/teichoic acid biosynthesis glycosyltransferase